MPITLAEKITCLERELNLRKRVYPRLIDRGKMRPRESDHEIEVIAAILEDYRQHIKNDVDDLPLFR